MFPRKKQLSRTAFPSALKGRRVSSPHFVAVFSKEAIGYAVVVPKKVARLSVTRHKIKRRALEALRVLPPPPFSLILFPKPAVAEMPHKEVVQELTSLLSKIPQ